MRKHPLPKAPLVLLLVSMLLLGSAFVLQTTPTSSAMAKQDDEARFSTLTLDHPPPYCDPKDNKNKDKCKPKCEDKNKGKGEDRKKCKPCPTETSSATNNGNDKHGKCEKDDDDD